MTASANCEVGWNFRRRSDTMNSRNNENKKFAHNAHSVGVSEYHLQWVTKYRYVTLSKESHYIDCENALRSAAKRHGIILKELGVMLDHVHAAVVLPQTMSPEKAVGLLKGASAYELFKLHPNSDFDIPKGIGGGVDTFTVL